MFKYILVMMFTCFSSFSQAQTVKSSQLEYRFVKTWTQLNGTDLINNLKLFNYIVPEKAGVEDIYQAFPIDSSHIELLNSSTQLTDTFCRKSMVNLDLVPISSSIDMKKIVTDVKIQDNVSQTINNGQCENKNLFAKNINYSLIVFNDHISVEYDDEAILPRDVIPLDYNKILIRIPTDVTKLGSDGKSIFYLNYFFYITRNN